MKWTKEQKKVFHQKNEHQCVYKWNSKNINKKKLQQLKNKMKKKKEPKKHWKNLNIFQLYIQEIEWWKEKKEEENDCNKLESRW